MSILHRPNLLTLVFVRFFSGCHKLELSIPFVMLFSTLGLVISSRMSLDVLCKGYSFLGKSDNPLQISLFSNVIIPRFFNLKIRMS